MYGPISLSKFYTKYQDSTNAGNSVLFSARFRGGPEYQLVCANQGKITRLLRLGGRRAGLTLFDPS
jgi:hypothetical protein